MASFDKSIDVDVPVAEAYMLFSDFERFPAFMEGIESVERVGPEKLHWKAEIGGREEEWDAKITEQMPSTKIAWESTSGARNIGTVTFDKLDQDTTRVNLHIEYDPQGFVENVGAMLGIVNGRMAGDLRRFKELVEEGGAARGGWHDSAGTQQEMTAEELDKVKPRDLMDGGQRHDPAAGRQTRRADHQRDHQAMDRQGGTAGGINDRMYSGTDLSDVEQRGNDHLRDDRGRGGSNMSGQRGGNADLKNADLKPGLADDIERMRGEGRAGGTERGDMGSSRSGMDRNRADGMDRHSHDATTGADGRSSIMNRGTERVRDGMNSGYDSVNDTVGYGTDSVRNTVEQASGDNRGAVNDLGGTLGTGINNARDTLGSGVENARNSVERTVDDAVDRLDDVDERTDATNRTKRGGRIDRDDLRDKRR